MTNYRKLAATLLLCAATLPAAAPAHPPIAADAAAATFEQDRADILAMAGNYKVRFDMQESTRWDPAYQPLEPKKSGGNEVVRLIEDSGRKIVLQHLLVIEHEGKSHIIKHWRQDWEYEPAKILAYSDRNAWAWEDVPERMRPAAGRKPSIRSMTARATQAGASSKRRAAFAAGGRAGRGARSPAAMPSATPSMTVICRSTATSSRPTAGSTGRTIPRWA